MQAAESTIARSGVGLPARTRIQALDVLRGIVIILMALDHVRDSFHESGWAYDPLDIKFTTPILFATRWITHYCAATFVFLAGVSIWLQAAKGKQTGELSKFLFTRGLWIVFLEVTVIAFGWSFSIPLLPHLQVMWAIGLSMVALSALIYLPQAAVLGIGVAIICLHNLLDPISAKTLGSFGPWWKVLHEGGMLYRNGQPIAVAFYPIIPWIGLMSFGYGMGGVFLSPRRDRILLRLGAAMVAGFLIFRGLHLYGDPLPWSFQADPAKTVMLFFNVQKYPPSLMYVCMTIGPVLMLLPWIDRWKSPVAEFFRTFGAVPMMAYITHLYVQHALAIVVLIAAGKPFSGQFNAVYNGFLKPEAFQGEGFPLWVTYVMWVIVIAIIYPICKWWGGVKRTRRDWWLSYL